MPNQKLYEDMCKQNYYSSSQNLMAPHHQIPNTKKKIIISLTINT